MRDFPTRQSVTSARFAHNVVPTGARFAHNVVPTDARFAHNVVPTGARFAHNQVLATLYLPDLSLQY